MGRKLALIIGNSRYEDTGLARLPTADVDVRELADVLRAEEIGGFDEIVELPDMGLAVVRRSIAQFFSQAKKDDLLVFYFSGHGVKDENGHLYLAVRDTEVKLLSGTSIEAAFITSQMDRSPSKRQILILDCCHSGAFAQGAKGAASQVVGTGPAFEGTGYGHVVLTATDSTQYAWEGDRIIGESDKSVFTHYILQGLKTGDADLDGDGKITVDELYEYVYEQVVRETPKQTPGKWSYKQQGDIVVAKNPKPQAKPAALPLELQAMVESPIPRIRAEAVAELKAFLHGKHRGLEVAARNALELLSTDDSRKVSGAACDVLGIQRPSTAPRLPRPPVAQRQPEQKPPDTFRKLPDTLYMARDAQPEPLEVGAEDVPAQKERRAFFPSVRVQVAFIAAIVVIALITALNWRGGTPQPQGTDVELVAAPPPIETRPSPAPVPPPVVISKPKPEPPAPKPAPSGTTKPPAGVPAATGAAAPAPSNSEEISRLLQQGDDLLKSGRYGEAIAAYEQAARLGDAAGFARASKARAEQKDQIDSRLRRVAGLLDTGDYSEALSQIKPALAVDSKNAEALSLSKRAIDAQNFERTAKVTSENPWTETQIDAALKILSPVRLTALVKEFGTTFILDVNDERRFRTAAATARIGSDLIDPLVRLLAPPRERVNAGTEWTPPTDRRPMVFIPAGTFQMGSPAGEAGRDADEASHSVTLATGFWMESAEVTYRAYRRFLLASPEWQKGRIDRRLHDGNYLSDWKGIEYPAGKADQPVVHVSWYAAQAYAKWAGKRLPTEAEWEYACRGGRRGIYWWGDSFDAAPSGASGFASARNPWGLVAMLGGVWEWTSSVYRSYPFADDGRNDATAQGPRVIRGGAGTSGPNILRSANRNRDEPERCSDLLGFRCVF